MDFPFPIMLLVTLVASLGFALFFNVNKRRIIPATLGGVFTWAIYYVLFAAVFAETMSRITHTPVTGFFIISVIPLIPGRALYYTMYNAVSGNLSACGEFGIMTMLYAGGIAVGICVVTAVVQTWDVWAADKAKRIAKMVRKQTHRKA